MHLPPPLSSLRVNLVKDAFRMAVAFTLAGAPGLEIFKSVGLRSSDHSYIFNICYCSRIVFLVVL